MSRRKDGIDRESLREKLVAVAEALVSQRGSDALTARALAEHIGYSVGHVYNLVPDLDALILIVNGRTLDKLLEHLKLSIKGRKGGARLHGLAAGYLAFCAENPRLWSLVLDHRLAEGREVTEEYALQIAALPALVASELQSLFPERSSSRITEDVALLWASLHGLGALDSSGRLSIIQAPPAPELAKQLIDVYLEGSKGKTH